VSKLVYKPLEPLTKVQIEEQLKRGNEEELKMKKEIDSPGPDC